MSNDNKQEAIDAAYQNAATQILLKTKAGLIFLLENKGLSPAEITGVSEFLNTPAGSRILVLFLVELSGLGKGDSRGKKLMDHMLAPGFKISPPNSLA